MTEYIRVIGANDNNLQNISVDIPKRSLTVFTGVSGSGKSTLVFDTIAAESQRLVNETYPSFVQGFMSSLARPNVDQLEGLTAAVIVGQEPMGANARSTFGTATDITGMLRVLYSRIAEPNAGGPAAYSFNVPSVSGQGAIQADRAGAKKEVARFERTGGMCPKCEGMGRVSDIDISEVVDENLSLNEGAILLPGAKVDSWMWKAYAESDLYPADKPVKDFTAKQREALLYLDDVKVKIGGINMSYQGLIPRMRSSMLSKDPEALQKHIREFVEKAVVFVECPECEGTRLAPHARESKIEGKSIADLCEMELWDLAQWLQDFKNPQVAPLVETIAASAKNAVDIGLGYLTLSRPSGTLSGGEAQRTRMVRHLGSALTDVTYVFDEPSAGLHPADIERMNNLLLALRDKGNTVLVVEHKPETIALADHIVDLGPRAGSHGGTIVFEGTVAELRKADTLTGKHLADTVALKDTLRKPKGTLEIRNANRHNLRNVDVDIPTGVLTSITGVSGSGKSSLLSHLPEELVEQGRIEFVDQTQIKGSRRSNPATYTGALEPIRKAFAKENGVKPGLFSANSTGACPNCNGAGVVYVELGIMSGVDVPCEVCEGRRFSEDVLEYKLGEKNIADVLELPAEQAHAYFLDSASKVPAAAKVCASLEQVGLGYLTLGQPLNTLSGGERQRLKLAMHLSKKKDAADILVLDEPTTGLHLADVEMLLGLLDLLVDSGTTVICIEHHLAVVAHSDHIVDMGPGAGSRGGTVVVSGSPAELMEAKESVTGGYLKKYLSA
ncbi:ATP-binding cassette domain-containing protein [Corynebacterium suicordis]